MIVELFAKSDVGRVRRGNEDNFLVLDLTTEQTWTGADGEIRVYGNVQVTAVGAGNAHCKADASLQRDGAHVQCYSSNGAFIDTQFTVLFGS